MRKTKTGNYLCMATRNVKLMHEFCLQHSSLETTRQKQIWHEINEVPKVQLLLGSTFLGDSLPPKQGINCLTTLTHHT